MRKRYQKVDRGLGVTRPHGDEAPKKPYDPYEENRYKQSADRYDPVQQDPRQALKQKLQLEFADKDIPPQLKSVLRLMVQDRLDDKRQKPKLMKLMVIIFVLAMLFNIFLANSISIGGLGRDAFNFVFMLGIIAAVIFPIGFITWKLESVMSKKNASRVGAGIILFLIYLFFSWFISNWGY